MRRLFRSPALLSAAMLVLAAHPSLGRAQPSGPASVPTLTITESGETSVEPDRASVRFAVAATASEATDAMNRVSQAMSKATAAIRDLGIADRDLQTSAVSLNPRYDDGSPQSNGDSPEIVGYEARNSLAVTVRDIDRLGQVLDTAIANGANAEVGIAMEVADPKAAQNKARRRAIANATKAAEAMAASAGRKLGAIRSIEDMGGSGPGPQPLMMRAAQVSGGVPIETGTQTLTATVTMVFTLGKPDAGRNERGGSGGTGEKNGDRSGDGGNGSESSQ